MNREVLQNIFLVVFGIALILVGYAVFTQSTELSDLGERLQLTTLVARKAGDDVDMALTKITTLEEDALRMNETIMKMEEAATQKDIAISHSSSVVNWDLSFDYPNGWYVGLYDDAFTSGQKNLRLTSSKGQLIYAVSSGGPASGSDIFEEGFQVNIFGLAEGQNPFESSEETKYANIVKDNGLCEAGCPDERYIFTGTGGRFEIDFYYTQSAEQVDVILSSLREETGS